MPTNWEKLLFKSERKINIFLNKLEVISCHRPGLQEIVLKICLERGEIIEAVTLHLHKKGA